MSSPSLPAAKRAAFGMPAHPGSSGDAISARMSRARRRDTAPELALRRALHASGLRYRVVYPVPGNRRRTIDIAFPRQRLAVFVDGCFWHGCPEHGTAPRANADWWQAKISTNQARDRDTDRLLSEAGWRTLRLWEHTTPQEALELVVASICERPTGAPVHDRGRSATADKKHS